MGGKVLRGLAYAALAGLIAAASCDAVLDREDAPLRFPAPLEAVDR